MPLIRLISAVEEGSNLTNVLEIAGDVSLFGLRALTDLFRRPFEGDQLRRQLFLRTNME